MCRLINKLNIQRLTTESRTRDSHTARRSVEEVDENVWPVNNETYRGIGMPEQHFEFFKVGVKYRVPMYVATSTEKVVAERFMRRNIGDGRLPVLFTFEF